MLHHARALAAAQRSDLVVVHVHMWQVRSWSGEVRWHSATAVNTATNDCALGRPWSEAPQVSAEHQHGHGGVVLGHHGNADAHASDHSYVYIYTHGQHCCHVHAATVQFTMVHCCFLPVYI